MMTEMTKRTRFIFRFYWLAVATMIVYAIVVAWQRTGGQLGMGMVGHGFSVFFSTLVVLSVLSFIAGYVALAAALSFKTPRPEVYYGLSWVLFITMISTVWWFFYTSEPPLQSDLLTLVWFFAFYYLLNVPNFRRYAQYFYEDGEAETIGRI